MRLMISEERFIPHPDYPGPLLKIEERPLAYRISFKEVIDLTKRFLSQENLNICSWDYVHGDMKQKIRNFILKELAVDDLIIRTRVQIEDVLEGVHFLKGATASRHAVYINEDQSDVLSIVFPFEEDVRGKDFLRAGNSHLAFLETTNKNSGAAKLESSSYGFFVPLLHPSSIDQIKITRSLADSLKVRPNETVIISTIYQLYSSKYLARADYGLKPLKRVWDYPIVEE